MIAKKIALAIDSNYYAGLWINSGESGPGWPPPPDTAAAESHMGNEFWTAWSANFARRLLAQAAVDKRFAFGESLISVWPWPNRNFGRNLDNKTRLIGVDDDGDEFGRPMYLPPNSSANAHFLRTIRYLLIQNWDSPGEGKPDTLRLLFATPRPREPDKPSKKIVLAH